MTKMSYDYEQELRLVDSDMKRLASKLEREARARIAEPVRQPTTLETAEAFGQYLRLLSDSITATFDAIARGYNRGG